MGCTVQIRNDFDVLLGSWAIYTAIEDAGRGVCVVEDKVLGSHGGKWIRQCSEDRWLDIARISRSFRVNRLGVSGVIPASLCIWVVGVHPAAKCEAIQSSIGVGKRGLSFSLLLKNIGSRRLA